MQYHTWDSSRDVIKLNGKLLASGKDRCKLLASGKDRCRSPNHIRSEKKDKNINSFLRDS